MWHARTSWGGCSLPNRAETMWPNVLLLLADALAIVLLARLLLQWAQLHYTEPLAQFCRSSTDWLVRPLRKISPPLGRWDGACILAVWLVYYTAYTLVMLAGLPETRPSGRLVAANGLFTLLSSFKALAYVLLFGLVIRMILSFAAPHAALMPVLQRLFDPLTRPFAALRIGRFDFSASLLVLLLWLWLSVLLPSMMARINLWLLSL